MELQKNVQRFIFVKFFFIFYCVFPYQVSEMAVSELPGNPNAVWTVRRHVEGIDSSSLPPSFYLSNSLCMLTVCNREWKLLLFDAV